MRTSSSPIHVLISLYKGYGMGDGCQMSAVLRHVAKYRPHWIVDYQAERGREVVGRGIVRNVFVYGDPQPSAHYDAEVQICLYDSWANWGDRPNTRVSSCLHERFDLPWDAECGRYQVNVRESVMDSARAALTPMTDRKDKNKGIVAIHYEGDSSQERKNLSHAQATQVCKTVEQLGRVPLLLDWRNRSPLPNQQTIHTVGRFCLSKEWGGDAELNCAIIRQCEAFVGIDSGPGKCASSTDTPALVTWVGHHPAPFHDPAPNTTHLVPRGYHGLFPVCDDLGVVEWFEKNYNVRQYERDPVDEIKAWLRETLR